MDLDARKLEAAELTGYEKRRVTFESFEMREADDGLIQFGGHASVTENAYDMGYYQETIQRGAFAKTLSEGAQVKLLINHDGLPIARTGKNMTLTEDERGLRVDAQLNPALPLVQELRLTANDGLIDAMSFAFRVTRQSWDEDYEHRTIQEVNLDRGDVSVVTEPANPAASFTMRDAREFLDRLTAPEIESLIRARTSRMSEDPKIVSAVAEYRAAGATDDQMDALTNVLNLIDASDTNVDKALIALSAFMGVTNPDIAQDKALDRAASLGTYRARALALSLAAR